VQTAGSARRFSKLQTNEPSPTKVDDREKEEAVKNAVSHLHANDKSGKELQWEICWQDFGINPDQLSAL